MKFTRHKYGKNRWELILPMFGRPFNGLSVSSRVDKYQRCFKYGRKGHQYYITLFCINIVLWLQKWPFQKKCRSFDK